MIRQLLTESVVLCLLGGGLGLLVAQWGLELLLAISPVSLADLGSVHLSYQVLGFTAAVSLATAIVCGVVAALAGPAAEIAEERAGIYEYTANVDGLFGVGPWLVPLYFAFGVAVARLAELLSARER